MKYFQINHLSSLHNVDNIIFCKTDFIKKEFDYISTLNHNIVLITGNSDYPITDNLLEICPKNIKKWFCQNALSRYEKVIPIPLGIENKEECKRPGHGVGYYSRVLEKENLLNNVDLFTKPPQKYIYCNFNINTNFNFRNNLLQFCKKINYIDIENYGISLTNYFTKIKEYKMIICPVGNGVDTHRLWEVLYSNVIPIIFRVGNYKIYELYEKLPIIILDEFEQLNNFDLLESHYKEALKRKCNKELLTTDYWINLIKNESKKCKGK